MATLVRTAFNTVSSFFLSPRKSRKRLQSEVEEDAEHQVCEYRPQQRRRTLQAHDVTGLASSAVREWYPPTEDPQVVQRHAQQRATGVKHSPNMMPTNRVNYSLQAKSPLQPQLVTPGEEWAYLRGFYGPGDSTRSPHDKPTGLAALPAVAGSPDASPPQRPMFVHRLSAQGHIASAEDGDKGKRNIPPLDQRILTSKEANRSLVVAVHEGNRLLEQVSGGKEGRMAPAMMGPIQATVLHRPPPDVWVDFLGGSDYLQRRVKERDAADAKSQAALAKAKEQLRMITVTMTKADGLPYDGGPGESLLKAQLEGVQLKRTLDAKQDRVFEVAADVMDRPVPAVPSQVPEVTAAHEVIEVLDDDEVEETDVEEERVEELDEEERNVEEEAADELEEEPDEEEEEEEIVLLSDSEDDVGEEAAPREQPVEPRQQGSSLEDRIKSMSVSEAHLPGKRFTKAELKEIQRALSGRPTEDILAIHKRSGVEMTRRLIQCLLPGAWLNDEVMNMYMGLLQDRDSRRRGTGLKPSCHFVNTFFVCKLFQDKQEYDYDGVKAWTRPRKLKMLGQLSDCVLDVDRMLVPIHLPGHWVSAVIDFSGQRVVFMDSMGGRNSEIPAALLQWVADEHKDKRGADVDMSDWRIEYKSVPRQQNGHDCGVFALQFLEHESRAADMEFSQKDMPYFRNRIALDLLQGTVPDSPP